MHGETVKLQLDVLYCVYLETGEVFGTFIIA